MVYAHLNVSISFKISSGNLCVENPTGHQLALAYRLILLTKTKTYDLRMIFLECTHYNSYFKYETKWCIRSTLQEKRHDLKKSQTCNLTITA